MLRSVLCLEEVSNLFANLKCYKCFESYSELNHLPSVYDPAEPLQMGSCMPETNCHVLCQALDGDFSEDNRNKCRIATAPLIEAVENLTAFASNPEFVSIPAQISMEVGREFYLYHKVTM